MAEAQSKNGAANSKLVTGAFVSLAICMAFYFHQVFFRSSISALSTVLEDVFNISKLSLSFVSASYCYRYALALLPAGILIDKLNSKDAAKLALLLFFAGMVFLLLRT